MSYPEVVPPTVFEFIVDEGETGRLDLAIARRFPGASRTRVNALFDATAVRIGRRHAAKGDRVVAGMTVSLLSLPVADEELRPLPDPAAAAQLEVQFEEPGMVAVSKPAGMPSHPLRAGELGTVANGLASLFPECASVGDDPREGGLVHRLDIGTSGVVVAARNISEWRRLRAAFSSGQIKKAYLAITVGHPVSASSDASLAQRGSRVVVDEVEGLSAHSDFRVISKTATHALIECLTQTGRMHQVRAHLANVGAPIVGDRLYGAHADADDDLGFYLHAWKIAVPAAIGTMDIVVPVPQRFADRLKKLGLKAD